jgi:hypothetical protein
MNRTLEAMFDARTKLAVASRALTANLLNIMAGEPGKGEFPVETRANSIMSGQLISQMTAVIEACHELQKLGFSKTPELDIVEALQGIYPDTHGEPVVDENDKVRLRAIAAQLVRTPSAKPRLVE